MENIFGRGNEQVFYEGTELPERHGPKWYLMVERHPRALGHTYDAQKDGTWKDVTKRKDLDILEAEALDVPAIIDKYEEVISILSGTPLDPSIAFMMLHREVAEYHQHGTVGNILTGIMETSTKTGQDLDTYLTPLFSDIGTALGRMIGRKLEE